MQWQAAPLFATPVFKLQILGAADAKAVFETKLKDTSDPNIQDVQGALSHFHSRGNVFEHVPDLAGLGEKLLEAGNFVYRDLMNYRKSGPLKVTNAWLNLCDLDGAQPMHNHVNCLLCGTFYLHADEHTKLNFEHPLASPSAHPELYDSPDPAPNEHGLRFHQRFSQIDVQSGDCLFWPAALRHGYSANKTPGRLSLSFNMMPEKLNVDYHVQV